MISVESHPFFSGEFVEGIKSQLEAYRHVDHHRFIQSVDWTQLGTSSSPMNTVGVMLLSLPALKDLAGSSHQGALNEKKRSYRELYESEPVDCFETLYLLDRCIGKIAGGNKVAFQVVACVLDGVVYDKMSSKNPSESQCRHFVALEHIVGVYSDSAVAKTARKKVRISVDTRVSRREAAYLEEQRFENEVFDLISNLSESDIARMSSGRSGAPGTA